MGLPEKTVLLAEIDRPRGIRGEVVATLHADSPSRLDEIETVWITRPGGTGEGREARVEGWKHKGERVVLKLTGIESVDEAREVQGWEVRIDAKDSPSQAPSGRWFAHQLEGLSVRRPSGEVLGTVVRVLCPAGQTLLEVENERGTWLLPLVPALCPRVDTDAGVIEVEPPEGLLELNAV